MTTGLEGLTAVVTGAGSGIGRATSRLLARRKARVVLADRDAAALESVETELRDEGHDAVPWILDVADKGAVQAAFSKLDQCDILVNCAGTEGPAGPLETCDLDDLDKVMRINVRGSLSCAQAAIRVMQRAGAGGAIVNLSSTAGLVGSQRLGIYAVSKAAVISMTRSLAISVARANIRVNAVCPGSIDSPMFDRTLTSTSIDEERARMISLHPLARLGQLDEVAEAIVFLASPAAAYITGAVLPVDGGRLA